MLDSLADPKLCPYCSDNPERWKESHWFSRTYRYFVAPASRPSRCKRGRLFFCPPHTASPVREAKFQRGAQTGVWVKKLLTKPIR